MGYYYLKAAMNCQRYKDPQGCQTLANLCVISMYNYVSVACKLYKQITVRSNLPQANSFYPDNGFKTGIPWIYYERAATEVIQANNRIKFRVSFHEINDKLGIRNRLHLKLAKYDIDGRFYGFEDLSDQLLICKLPTEEVNRIYNIGNTVES